MGKRDQECMLADAVLAYPREVPFVSTDVQREIVRRTRLFAYALWCVLTLIAMMVPPAAFSIIESAGDGMQARGVVIVTCEVLIVAGIGGVTAWYMHRLAVHKTIQAHPLIRTEAIIEVDIAGSEQWALTAGRISGWLLCSSGIFIAGWLTFVGSVSAMWASGSDVGMIVAGLIGGAGSTCASISAGLLMSYEWTARAALAIVANDSDRAGEARR